MATQKKGQTIHSQVRIMVKRVIEKCEEEALKGELLHAVYKPVVRAAEYTGLSKSTLTKIRHECSDLEAIVSSPPQKRLKHAEHEFRCTEKDKMLIRTILYKLYMARRVVTSGPKLLQEIRGEMTFPWNVIVLRKLLKSMGYKWKKYSNYKKVLIEKPKLVAWRGSYLKAVQSYRIENRNIIYIDEIWMDNTLTFGKYWQSEAELQLSKNTNTSERVIIVHAGGRNGFVPNAGLIFKSDNATSDYYGQIDAVKFESWVVEQLLPNIPPNTVVVIDTAPYHSIEINKPPHKYAKRADMLHWLKQNHLPHKEKMKKHELVELIARHKPTKKTYKVDEILKSYGHSVLRLPPYMRLLNPIEQAWTKIEQTITENSSFSTLTLDELQSLLPEAIDNVKASDWADFCEHTEQIEKECVDKDSSLEVALENLSFSSSDSENDDNESSCSEDF